MVETPDSVDPELGIPIFSLYSGTRKPTPRMIHDLDLLVIDLQDVGTRVYTFIHTTALCMTAAAEAGIRVMVLDRPNPIGGLEVEGNLLDPTFSSFVGLFPIPMRHGMTLGELAGLVNREYGIGCDLEVIPMRGWKRQMLFPDTGLPWVIPSPNLPTFDTAMVYPGQVLLEGTNLSEGRGTTRPFELFGAPWLDPAPLKERLNREDLPGVSFREHHFIPTFHKWKDKLCHGFQLHVTDPPVFRAYRTTLAVLKSVISLFPDRFDWKGPPYEYEREKLPIDLLIGDRSVREKLEEGAPLDELERGWRKGLEAFLKRRRKYLLYEN